MHYWHIWKKKKLYCRNTADNFSKHLIGNVSFFFSYQFLAGCGWTELHESAVCKLDVVVSSYEWAACLLHPLGQRSVCANLAVSLEIRLSTEAVGHSSALLRPYYGLRALFGRFMLSLTLKMRQQRPAAASTGCSHALVLTWGSVKYCGCALCYVGIVALVTVPSWPGIVPKCQRV